MSDDTELFKTQNRNIEELFGNVSSYYQIPEYQRPYSWGNKELTALWKDLEDAFRAEHENKNYFLGTIITMEPKNKEEDKHKDVIDGQQRITTLMILFCVIRDVYPDINKNGRKSATQIENIEECIKKRGEVRLRFYAHSSIRSNFESSVLEPGATQKTETQNDDKEQEEKNYLKKHDPIYKFIYSSRFFTKRLEDLGKDLGEFVDFLFKKVLIIEIICKNANFAIKLFQVINARGLKLTHAALTKSFLLEKIRNDGDSKDVIKHNEVQFKSDWEKIEENIKKRHISMDDLLSMYQYYSNEKEHGKNLYGTLEEFFTLKFKQNIDRPRNPNKAIAEIKSFSEYYLNLFIENKEIFSLRYVPWKMLWRSILLTAMYKEYKHIDELRKELRKFYYIHWIAGKNLSHVKSPSFKIIRKIKEHASIKDMFEYAYKGSDYDEKYLIKEVGKKLQANDIASKVWCKQLLLLIEYATKEEGVPQSFIKLDKNIHLEHIMPRENREGWTHISDKTHKKYLNSAGNLTLLTGKKNIAASNKPFHEKMRIYEGDEDTKITSFNISRDILDAYRKRQEWDKDAMEARKEWFIKEVSKALDIEN